MKKKALDKNLTELVFVIDRSGSMQGLEKDTIGGVNSVLEKNRAVEGEAFVTIILFDHEIKYLYDHVDLRKVSNLTPADYQVRGCTALLDAVREAIEHTGRVHHYVPKSFRPKNVICTIVTDGLENASKRFTYRQIKQLIEKKETQGWEFLFLGANIDVAAEAGKLGISRENAAPYVADDKGTFIAYEAVAHAQVARRTVGAMPCGWADSVRADAAKRG